MGDDDRVRSREYESFVVGIEPPHHVRWRADLGVNFGDLCPLLRLVVSSTLDDQPVAHVRFHSTYPSVPIRFYRANAVICPEEQYATNGRGRKSTGRAKV